MRATLLGCGASWGVPAIGPDWGRCDPTDPRNRRRRRSLLVETQNRTILIDTAPDLREQLIDARVSRLDAVLLTHAHADHLHGLDDLRMISQLAGHAIPFYSSAAALEEVERRFSYAFRPVTPGRPVYRPALAAHANLGKVLGWVERLRPKRTVLTHMDQSLDYRELSAELPAGVEPGHDGLAVELPDS